MRGRLAYATLVTVMLLAGPPATAGPAGSAGPAATDRAGDNEKNRSKAERRRRELERRQADEARRRAEARQREDARRRAKERAQAQARLRAEDGRRRAAARARIVQAERDLLRIRRRQEVAARQRSETRRSSGEETARTPHVRSAPSPGIVLAAPLDPALHTLRRNARAALGVDAVPDARTFRVHYDAGRCSGYYVTTLDPLLGRPARDHGARFDPLDPYSGVVDVPSGVWTVRGP